jgi:hypothetical protein
MPLHTGLVRAVEESKGRFEVQLVEGPLVYTFHGWLASLCDRARVQGRKVHLTTQDTRYGLRIVSVELAEEGEAA